MAQLLIGLNPLDIGVVISGKGGRLRGEKGLNPLDIGVVISGDMRGSWEAQTGLNPLDIGVVISGRKYCASRTPCTS